MSESTDTSDSASERMQLTDPSKEILRVLFDKGGEATTRDIKLETGMGTDKIRYRARNSKDALADRFSLVELEQVPPEEYSGTGIPPKLLVLTEKGRQAIEQGLVGDLFEKSHSDEVRLSREQFESFDEQLNRLTNRVNTLIKGSDSNTDVESELSELTEEVEQLSDEVEALRSTVEDDHDAALVAVITALQAEFDIDISDYVDSDESMMG